METLVSIILIIGFIYILKKPSHDAHNRLCPPGKRLDYTQMGVDRSMACHRGILILRQITEVMISLNDIHTTPSRKK